jgi:hypothetical protein
VALLFVYKCRQISMKSLFLFDLSKLNREFHDINLCRDFMMLFYLLHIRSTSLINTIIFPKINFIKKI